MPLKRGFEAIVRFLLAAVQVAGDRELDTGLYSEIMHRPEDARRDKPFRSSAVDQIVSIQFCTVGIFTPSLNRTCGPMPKTGSWP